MLVYKNSISQMYNELIKVFSFCQFENSYHCYKHYITFTQYVFIYNFSFVYTFVFFAV